MNFKNWFILITTLGLGLRISLALSISPVLIYDSLEYHQYAANLVKEHRYYAQILSTPQAKKTGVFRSTRAPGYVFFISAIYKLFGINPKMVSLFQAILDSISAVFVLLISRNCFKPGYSLLAYLCYQIMPLYVPMIMSETLFIFLLLFSLWVLCGNRNKSSFWMSVNGIIWGMMVLTKPEAIIFIPAFLGFLLLKKNSNSITRNAFISFTFMSLMIAPWLFREKLIHGKWVWISTRGGMTFFDGCYLPVDKSRVMQMADSYGMDEVEMDRLFFKLSIEYLKKHPSHYFKAFFKRLKILFDLKTYDGMGRFVLTPLLEQGGYYRTALAFLVYYLFLLSRLVMIIGLLSAIFNLKKFKPLFLIYAIPLLLIALHLLIFHAKPRYLIPAYPSFCIFFSIAIAFLEHTSWHRLKNNPVTRFNLRR